jgi:hypothetical protein
MHTLPYPSRETHDKPFKVDHYIMCFLVSVGHALTAINGTPVTGRQLDDGRDVFDVLENEELFPLNLKFERLKMTTNEKIFLASMFYPLFAIASQLSPEPRSSGIEMLEADTFKLHCFQTLTGITCHVTQATCTVSVHNYIHFSSVLWCLRVFHSLHVLETSLVFKGLHTVVATD